ncbi:YkvA family protein [Haloimpatiens lingqiaonensis]|uniref:YkvA family protein n=1 Tax=Haloimpatiens lingqiaonensis TaxID=1380675 RepID=UPI0010FED317|nr:YkvA family protein [Haloimpatiens lingqiaonensis]
MRISSVNVALSSEDLLSILKDLIEEFLPNKGLNINEILLNEDIIIKGSYDGKISISFGATLEVCDVVNNMIKLKIKEIKVGKFKVFNFLKNFGIKKALASLKEYGIFVDKDYVVVALDKLEEYIPGAKFNILSISVKEEMKVEVDGLNIDLKELLKKDEEASSEELNEQEDIIVIEKKQDGYTEVRNNIIKKVPDKYKSIAKYAMIMPDMAALFVRLFKDKRVSKKVKVQLALIITYLGLPIDIFPDFIPFIGKIDDVAIAFFGLNKLFNHIDEEVILENWQGEEDIIAMVKEGVYYMSNVLGADKVSKLLFALRASKEEKVQEEFNEESKVNKGNKKDRCKDGVAK